MPETAGLVVVLQIRPQKAPGYQAKAAMAVQVTAHLEAVAVVHRR